MPGTVATDSVDVRSCLQTFGFLEEVDGESGRSEEAMIKGPIAEFDARKVFDAIDQDGNVELNYAELNTLVELNEFVRQINELSGEPKEMSCLTRSSLWKYFLQVMEDTGKLTIASEDAYDFCEKTLSPDGDDEERISREKLDISSLSLIVTDSQIHELAKVGLLN